MTEHKSTRYMGGGVNKTQYTLRGHQYDATGRLAKSSYSQYYAGDMPSVSLLEHVYAGANHVQNFDGTNYGAVWHWAGSANAHGAPLNGLAPGAIPYQAVPLQHGTLITVARDPGQYAGLRIGVTVAGGQRVVHAVATVAVWNPRLRQARRDLPEVQHACDKRIARASPKRVQVPPERFVHNSS